MAGSGFYGFQNVSANIVGPGGESDLANGAGAAEEGITIEAVQDQSTAEYGADGFVAHSLSAVTASNVTIRLSKLSPQNAILAEMFNLQSNSPALNGTNTISIRDIESGDIILLTDVAFTKRPAINYAKEAGMNEWVFIAGHTSQILGGGLL